MTFCTRVCHFMISTSTLSGIFYDKVGPFSGFLCQMEASPKYDFEGSFWENGFPFKKNFLKSWNF